MPHVARSTELNMVLPPRGSVTGLVRVTWNPVGVKKLAYDSLRRRSPRVGLALLGLVLLALGAFLDFADHNMGFIFVFVGMAIECWVLSLGLHGSE